jgi:uncharacterized protein YggE
MDKIKQVAFVAAGVLAAGVLTVAISGGSGPAGAARKPGSAAAPGGADAAAAFAKGAPAADPSSSAGDTGITVSGVGRVLGTPDTMRLSLGVSVTDSDVSSALDKANKSIARVTSALKGKGVKSEDVQTSGLSVGQDYDNNGKPKDYRVDEQMSVVLRDLSKAGSAISAAVAAGGNDVRVNGLSVDLADTSALITKAREDAFNDAKAKAEQYAKLSGRSLGKVTSVSEQVSTEPTPLAYAAQDAAGSASKALSDVPVSAGQTPVGVTITVVWSLS